VEGGVSEGLALGSGSHISIVVALNSPLERGGLRSHLKSCKNGVFDTFKATLPPNPSSQPIFCP